MNGLGQSLLVYEPFKKEKVFDFHFHYFIILSLYQLYFSSSMQKTTLKCPFQPTPILQMFYPSVVIEFGINITYKSLFMKFVRVLS